MKHTFLIFFLLFPIFAQSQQSQTSDHFDVWSDQTSTVYRFVEEAGFTLEDYAINLRINGYSRILYKSTTCPPFIVNGSLWDAERLSFQKNDKCITLWKSHARTTWVSCYGDRQDLCVEQTGKYLGITMGKVKKK